MLPGLQRRTRPLPPIALANAIGCGRCAIFPRRAAIRVSACPGRRRIRLGPGGRGPGPCGGAGSRAGRRPRGRGALPASLQHRAACAAVRAACPCDNWTGPRRLMQVRPMQAGRLQAGRLQAGRLAPAGVGGYTAPPPWRCRSSVVEHSLGKGEVESSIPSGSTNTRRCHDWYDSATAAYCRREPAGGRRPAILNRVGNLSTPSGWVCLPFALAYID